MLSLSDCHSGVQHGVRVARSFVNIVNRPSAQSVM